MASARITLEQEGEATDRRLALQVRGHSGLVPERELLPTVVVGLLVADARRRATRAMDLKQIDHAYRRLATARDQGARQRDALEIATLRHRTRQLSAFCDTFLRQLRGKADEAHHPTRERVADAVALIRDDLAIELDGRAVVTAVADLSKLRDQWSRLATRHGFAPVVVEVPRVVGGVHAGLHGDTARGVWDGCEGHLMGVDPEQLGSIDRIAGSAVWSTLAHLVPRVSADSAEPAAVVGEQRGARLLARMLGRRTGPALAGAGTVLPTRLLTAVWSTSLLSANADWRDIARRATENMRHALVDRVTME